MQRYRIVRGDNLSRIAKRHGLRSWRDIYFHPANHAFRQLRPNPNLIHPGDHVLIPDSSHNRPTLRQPEPIVPRGQDADHSDLQQAPAQAAIAQASKHSEGRPWVSRIAQVLKQLPFDAAQRMHSQGVIAIFFGRASVTRRGERPIRTELDGIQIKVKTGAKAAKHDGTKLYKNDRLSTFDGGTGLLFFLPDLSMIEVKPDMEILISGRSTRPARRQTRPAVLERGTLRERLSEL